MKQPLPCLFALLLVNSTYTMEQPNTVMIYQQKKDSYASPPEAHTTIANTIIGLDWKDNLKDPEFNHLIQPTEAIKQLSLEGADIANGQVKMAEHTTARASSALLAKTKWLIENMQNLEAMKPINPYKVTRYALYGAIVGACGSNLCDVSLPLSMLMGSCWVGCLAVDCQLYATLPNVTNLIELNKAILTAKKDGFPIIDLHQEDPGKVLINNSVVELSAYAHPSPWGIAHTPLKGLKGETREKAWKQVRKIVTDVHKEQCESKRIPKGWRQQCTEMLN